MSIAAAVATYANALQEKHDNFLHGNLGYKVEIEEGRKFYKIITARNSNGTGKSVHSFVDKATGSLYKAASWASPVKEERYNLLTELDLVLAVMDEYGSYLYKAQAQSNHTLNHRANMVAAGAPV
jgi:hypothetical protein